MQAVFDPLPVDVQTARACGRVYAAALEQGRQPRSRFADLLERLQTIVEI